MSDQPVQAPRRRRADLLGIGFVVVAVGLAGYGLRDQWPEVWRAMTVIGWWRLLLATTLATAGLLATGEVYRHCLGALGGPVSRAAARQIFFPSQIGKYLPGSVWPFLAQVRFAKRHGVAPATTLVAGAVFLVVHAVTSVPVATLVLFGRPSLADRLGWAGAGALVGLLLLHPKVLGKAIRVLGKRPDVELGWAQVGRPLAWMAPTWLCYGAAAFLLAAPLGGDPARLAVVCTGVFALGWLVGVVAVIAPAGLGAREAVIVLVLGPVLGVAAATSVALLLRVCHTVGDAALALGFGMGKPVGD